jgi:hypothetical protein
VEISLALKQAIKNFSLIQTNIQLPDDKKYEYEENDCGDPPLDFHAG